ncbi:MAG: glycosyltransferase family 4 protein [Clostridia bacterium]|nr:glycosyltransferase family 4 protein [Clostridia bacterium]
MAMPLHKLGWDISIIMLDTPENHKQIDLSCSTAIRVYYYTHAYQINNIVRSIKPYIIYINSLLFSDIFYIRYKCKKIVEYCELYSEYEDYSFIKRLKHKFSNYFAIFYSSGLVSASLYIKNFFDEKTKLPILYLPYAYNPTVTYIKHKEDIKSNIIKYEDKINFIYLGTIVRYYGIFTILKAVLILSRKYNNFRVIVCGQGKDYSNILKYIEENNLKDFIVAPGFVEENDIPDYFSIADAFLSPIFDTTRDKARCPSKLYMYLPYEKPIITCKIGEPYQTLGAEGLYYEPDNSEQLALKMEEVLLGEKTTININADNHNWMARAIEFEKWVKTIK